MTWILWSVKSGRNHKVPPELPKTPAEEFRAKIEKVQSETVVMAPLVAPARLTVDILPHACPTCDLIFPGKDALFEHESHTGHGRKAGTVVKIGTPLDDMDAPGAGMVLLKLKDGDKLPQWAEHERPVKIETHGEEIHYWYQRSGLKRIQ